MNTDIEKFFVGVSKLQLQTKSAKWVNSQEIQFHQHLSQLHYELRRPELPKYFDTIEEKGEIKEYFHEGKPYYWIYRGTTSGWEPISDIVNMITQHVYCAAKYFIQKPSNKNEIGFYMFNNTKFYYRCKQDKLGVLHWKCLFINKPESETIIELTLNLE